MQINYNRMERRFCSLLPVNDGEHEVAEGPERIQLQGDHGRAAEGGGRQEQVLAHHRPLTLPSPHLGVVAYDCRKLQATAKVCLPSYLVMNYSQVRFFKVRGFCRAKFEPTSGLNH